MKQKPLTIHSTKEEIQAFRTSETTDAVNVSRETLANKLDEVTNAVRNIPEVKIPEFPEIPDMTDKLNEVISAVKSIPKTIIPEPKEFPKMPEYPQFPTKMKVELEGAEIVTIKGKPGENGHTPIKGKDYYTPEEIDGIKKEITPTKNKDYFDGRDGYTPKKGQDYFTQKEVKQFKEEVTPIKGVDYRDGIDAKTPIKGVDYDDGNDGSPDTGEDIIEKLNHIKNALDFTILRNVPDFLTARDIGQGGTGGGGGVTLSFQDEGTTITQSPVTKLNVTGSGGSIVYSGNGVATLDLSGGGGSGTVTSVAMTVPTGLTISGSPITTTGTLAVALDTGYEIPLSATISGKADKSGALTQFVGNGNWKVWYSDGSGDVQELALGADGTFLKSNGAALAPSFATPAGSGYVSKVGTPVNNQIGIWTGDGTIEGDTDLTFDGTRLSVAELSVGNVGTEGTGINIGGVTYDSTMKVSDIDGTNYAQNIMHRHSTTLEPLILGARSNSDTTSHADMTAGQSVFSIFGAGWLSTNYKLFGVIKIAASALGSLSGTSAPGKLIFQTTPNASVTPTDHMILDSDKSTTFSGSISNGTSGVISTGTIELGHATDTTLSRVSAGVVAIEGVNILTVAGGTLTGNITLGENTSIALDPAGSADGKYSGTTITGISGYAQAFGDLVTLDKDDSRWEAVDISVAAAATGDARGIMGMVVSAGTDGNACTILLQGIIRADANFPALTIGAAVYASTTGDIVVTQPSTVDYVIRIVGHAMTADEIMFNPDNSWITHT
jgi:hypothetical protein